MSGLGHKACFSPFSAPYIANAWRNQQCMQCTTSLKNRRSPILEPVCTMPSHLEGSHNNPAVKMDYMFEVVDAKMFT